MNKHESFTYGISWDQFHTDWFTMTRIIIRRVYLYTDFHKFSVTFRIIDPSIQEINLESKHQTHFGWVKIQKLSWIPIAYHFVYQCGVDIKMLINNWNIFQLKLRNQLAKERHLKTTRVLYRVRRIDMRGFFFIIFKGWIQMSMRLVFLIQPLSKITFLLSL